MWANLQEIVDLVNLLKKSFMENFIFCAAEVELEIWPSDLTAPVFLTKLTNISKIPLNQK